MATTTAMSLGSMMMTQTSNNYVVTLLQPPIFIRQMSDMQIAEVDVLKDTIVLHAGADKQGNFMVVIRVGAVKIGPFYGKITTSTPMKITLDMNAILRSGDLPKPMLTGSFTFSIPSTKKDINFICDIAAGPLTRGSSATITTPTSLMSFSTAMSVS